MNKVFSGYCFVCFTPVEKGKEYFIRPGGRLFHQQCVEGNPMNTYVLLEKQWESKPES